MKEHWGVISNFIVSIFVGFATLTLFWKQGKTMRSQELIQEKQKTLMETQTEINKKLMSLEESRNDQANYVSAFATVEMKEPESYGKLKRIDGIPIHEAITLKIHVTNQSYLPIYGMYLGLTGKPHPKKPTKTHSTYGLVVGVLKPKSEKTFQVSPEVIKDDAHDNQVLPIPWENPHSWIGLLEEHYSVFYLCKSSQGTQFGRGDRGQFLNHEELKTLMEPTEENRIIPIKGEWIS